MRGWPLSSLLWLHGWPATSLTSAAGTLSWRMAAAAGGFETRNLFSYDDEKFNSYAFASYLKVNLKGNGHISEEDVGAGYLE